MLYRSNSDVIKRKQLDTCSFEHALRPSVTEPQEQSGAYQGAVLAANTAFQHANRVMMPREGTKVVNKLQKQKPKSSSEGSHLARRQVRKSTSSDANYPQRKVLRKQTKDEGVMDHNGTRPKSPSARAQDFLETDLRLELHSTKDETVASEPSSYKKLPKSLSASSPKNNGTTMQTNRHKHDADFSPHDIFLSSQNGGRAEKWYLSPEMYGEPVTGISSPPVTTSIEQSRNESRDKILRSFQQTKLREKSSFSSILTKKKQDLPQAQSPVGYSSNVTYDNDSKTTGEGTAALPNSSCTSGVGKEESRSLRSRFMKIFRKPSQAMEGLPAQHLNATKRHFGSDMISISSSSKRPSDSTTTCDEKEMYEESSSPVTDTHVAASQATSRVSSGTHSQSGDSNAKSRVTSWSNSTVANSLSSKPLSIIDERTSRVNSIREPKGPGQQHQRSTQAQGKWIKSKEHRGLDARRLYSALMKKESDTTRDLNESGPSNVIGLKKSHLELPSQSRKSSFGALAAKLHLSQSDTPKVEPESHLIAQLHCSPVEFGKAEMSVQVSDGEPFTVNDHVVVPRARDTFGPEDTFHEHIPAAENATRRIENEQVRWKSTLKEAYRTNANEGPDRK